MIKQFESLTETESELLLKAPILLSVLASTLNHEINEEEKEDAIKLAHLKTFTSDPLLHDYYKEVEKNFSRYFELVEEKYQPFDDSQREALKKEIEIVNGIISKLDKEFAEHLHKSLTGYVEHVKKAGHGLLENFIFPVPITGLNN